MKKILLIFYFLIFYLGGAQQNLVTNYSAAYTVFYKIGRDSKEQVMLFMNTKTGESYYISSNNYLLEKKIKNGTKADRFLLYKHRSYLNEKVYQKNNQLSVFAKISAVKVHYKETPTIKWTVTKEKKEYHGKKLTKAYANVFGRKWYAWFSNDPLPFAPYKFVGLPGLVMILEDENKNFTFKLTSLKKKKYNNVIPNPKKYIKIPKSKFEQINYNTKVIRISELVKFNNSKEKKKYKKDLEKVYNMLPKLDIQYPYQP